MNFAKFCKNKNGVVELHRETVSALKPPPVPIVSEFENKAKYIGNRCLYEYYPTNGAGKI
jgi:hypothetical protein